MKKMKFLLGAVAVIASLSAFTVPVKLDCPGAYVYTGSGDPETDTVTDEDFLPASQTVDCNTETTFICKWFRIGENTYIPCPDSPTGKYTPPTKAQISR